MSLPLSQGRRGGSTAFIEVAPEAGWERWLEHHADGNLIAGIRRIAQVILTVDVVDVNVVGVIPAYRPRLNEAEPVAAVLEARIS